MTLHSKYVFGAFKARLLIKISENIFDIYLTEGGTYPQLPTQPIFFAHFSNWYSSLVVMLVVRGVVDMCNLLLMAIWLMSFFYKLPYFNWIENGFLDKWWFYQNLLTLWKVFLTSFSFLETWNSDSDRIHQTRRIIKFIWKATCII